MPNSQSLYTTRRGEFRRIYREVKRHKQLRTRTPVVFCEGDSWFSTPLSMNIIDWLVYPSPEDEKKGVPIFGRGGLFFRAEKSGDLAMDMFAPKRLKDIMQWYGSKQFEFDLALLSAGGNDFVDAFLKKVFAGKGRMTPAQAFELMVATGRYDQVYQAYERILDRMVKLRPATPIIGHTYCYPIKLGTQADLTLANLGAAALLKTGIGPWIEPHLRKALPNIDEQRQFTRLLVDGIVDKVLEPLAQDARFKRNFRYLDLRNALPKLEDWADEMHPTGAGFYRLSKKFANEINILLNKTT